MVGIEMSIKILAAVGVLTILYHVAAFMAGVAVGTREGMERRRAQVVLGDELRRRREGIR